MFQGDSSKTVGEDRCSSSIFRAGDWKSLAQYNYTHSVDLWRAIFQARNNIFLFGKKFLIAITPLYQMQKELKIRFRGNLDEDPLPPLYFKAQFYLYNHWTDINFQTWSLILFLMSGRVKCCDANSTTCSGLCNKTWKKTNWLNLEMFVS